MTGSEPSSLAIVVNQLEGGGGGERHRCELSILSTTFNFIEPAPLP